MVTFMTLRILISIFSQSYNHPDKNQILISTNPWLQTIMQTLKRPQWYPMIPRLIKCRRHKYTIKINDAQRELKIKIKHICISPEPWVNRFRLCRWMGWMLAHNRNGLSWSSLCLILDSPIGGNGHPVCWRVGATNACIRILVWSEKKHNVSTVNSKSSLCQHTFIMKPNVHPNVSIAGQCRIAYSFDPFFRGSRINWGSRLWN